MEEDEAPRTQGRSTLRKLQHDLREPIGQILGYGEMLREEFEERELLDLVPDLDHVRAAANTLLALVDGVFRADEQNLAEMSSEAGETVATPVDASSDTRDASLLLVDDEAANRQLLTRQLERVGYQVTEADSGSAALSAVQTTSFDLVLLDVLMPGMDGLETLTALRQTHSATDLPIVMATALSGTDDVVAALAAGANDYVTKPFDMKVVTARIQTQLDLRAAAREVERLAQQLEIRNAFLRQTFGRFISDDVVASLLESDEGFEIRGERRRVSILMADLRGFTSLTESLGPEEIVAILNSYLSVMANVVQEHHGTVDELLGDAILAHFGAITTRDDDAERCVACAIAMQRAIGEVNRISAERGLPNVEMGIGIATGNVVVGIVGSDVRSKHTAIGSAVNLAARIEGQSLGGEVLISQATHDEIAHLIDVDEVREVWPKGFDSPQQIHRVSRIGGGKYTVAVPPNTSELVELIEPLDVSFAHVKSKRVEADVHRGQLVAVSQSEAILATDKPLEPMTELRITLDSHRDGAVQDASFAKVVGRGDRGATLRFTLLAPAMKHQCADASPTS